MSGLFTFLRPSRLTAMTRLVLSDTLCTATALRHGPLIAATVLNRGSWLQADQDPPPRLSLQITMLFFNYTLTWKRLGIATKLQLPAPWVLRALPLKLRLNSTASTDSKVCLQRPAASAY